MRAAAGGLSSGGRVGAHRIADRFRGGEVRGRGPTGAYRFPAGGADVSRGRAQRWRDSHALAARLPDDGTPLLPQGGPVGTVALHARNVLSLVAQPPSWPRTSPAAPLPRRRLRRTGGRPRSASAAGTNDRSVGRGGRLASPPRGRCPRSGLRPATREHCRGFRVGWASKDVLEGVLMPRRWHRRRAVADEGEVDTERSEVPAVPVRRAAGDRAGVRGRGVGRAVMRRGAGSSDGRATSRFNPRVSCMELGQGARQECAGRSSGAPCTARALRRRRCDAADWRVRAVTVRRAFAAGPPWPSPFPCTWTLGRLGIVGEREAYCPVRGRCRRGAGWGRTGRLGSAGGVAGAGPDGLRPGSGHAGDRGSRGWSGPVSATLAPGRGPQSIGPCKARSAEPGNRSTAER